MSGRPAKARAVLASCAFALAIAWSGSARAVELPRLWNKPLELDVTETTVVAQRFGAREDENPVDQGYGAWLNRLNVALKWERWTVGTRLDSSLYWLRAQDRTYANPSDKRNAVFDGASRYRDMIYPAKLWATYKSANLEATVGDAYVQFGRGLILSMRKVDELGIDNTVRGGKVTWTSDPFAATLVAGVANPARVDEATGRALFLPSVVLPTPGQPASPPQPIFGSDRIVGAEIQAGRGLPVVLTTHAVRVTRCAPYHYRSDGSVADGALDSPLGSCDPADTAEWLSTLSSGGNPTQLSSEVMMVGQGVEIPSLWKHGSIYVEGAAQHRSADRPNASNLDGNALYASISTNAGPVTNTLEFKSYRNFYAAQGAVNLTKAVAFANVAYSSPPTTELLMQDSMFGFACVTGGRLRTDVRLTETLLVYGAAEYFLNQTELPGGGCDRLGHTYATTDPTTTTWDGLSGFEYRFDRDRSFIYAWGGVRDDQKVVDDSRFYREAHVDYSFSKHLTGPFTLEITGRHRIRNQEGENRRGENAIAVPWREGENYTAIKIAPKWVFTQGLEYTTRVGSPTYFFNGSFLYRFTSESNLRVLVGQQRGGLKCVSGICKVFPPFEGARAELTIRF